MIDSCIDEDFKGLDVNQESQYAQLHRQATEDAAFLRHLCMKQDNAVNVPSPSSLMHHQEYAFYRQKYLIMYNPFRGKKEDKKFTREKIKKLFIVNLKKKNAKTTQPN